MNKINLIIMPLFLILCSCDRKGIADNILEDCYINQTNRELFIVSQTTVKSDSGFCHSNDSISFVFINKVNYSIPFVGPYNLDEGIYPMGVYVKIYNLSDTTLFITGQVLTAVEKNLIVSKHSLGFRHHIDKLYINNDFLLLFKKDYTMLDKFKDYYKK